MECDSAWTAGWAASATPYVPYGPHMAGSHFGGAPFVGKPMAAYLAFLEDGNTPHYTTPAGAQLHARIRQAQQAHAYEQQVRFSQTSEWALTDLPNINVVA